METIKKINFEEKLNSLCYDCLDELIAILEGNEIGGLAMYDKENEDTIPRTLVMYNGLLDYSYDIEFRAIDVVDGVLTIYDEEDAEYTYSDLVNTSEIITIYHWVLERLEELGLMNVEW